jgi:hypothetical protein
LSREAEVALVVAVVRAEVALAVEAAEMTANAVSLHKSLSVSAALPVLWQVVVVSISLLQ